MVHYLPRRRKMKSINKLFILVTFILSLLMLPACGPSPEEQELISYAETAMAATPSPVAMPFHMKTITFPSENTGRTYNLYISLPLFYYPGARDYPSIYVLDGDILFGTTKEVVHALAVSEVIEDHVVVGIGYDTNKVEEIFAFRAAEYDPHGEDNEDFKLFLMDELIPFIEANYDVRSSDRTLLGHSYSAEFSLDFMFEYPEVFSRIVAGSPEVGINNKELFDVEKAFAQGGGDLAVNLYIGVGGEEEYIIGDIAEFVGNLENSQYQSLALEYEIVEGEGHNQMIPFVISKGIRAVNK
jgi:predicted alpha/beta superfamily hydrolase